MAGDVQNLIRVVNKLQDVFSSIGSSMAIDLPQIAVVGGQSAGKSSVLENFVGRDFLPRGAGIVTRRPLILQLINQNGPEYAEFLHCKNQKFTDFLKVRAEIEAETDRVTGSNKNISPLPINLRVYSPAVLNLTLIDLPGLTKVPVGDQPKDIERQIRDMVITYISSPNCLILAVTPAVIDLANSEALQLAKEVDPDRKRTIGVITKIDLMDKGTDCKDVLNNTVYPLNRGYIGIVNRSQQDINGKKDILAAQEAELIYFQTTPAYRSIADKCGSQYLQQTLNLQLSQHIKDTLPSLKQKIIDQINSIERKMGNTIGSLKPPTAGDKAKILLTGIQEFSRQVNSVLGYQQETVDTSELSAGSTINNLLYQRFRYVLDRAIPDKSIIKKEIDVSIKNSQGVKNTIFTPDVAFTSVVKKHIEDTRKCCLRIPELVVAEIRKIIEKSCENNFANYPILLTELISFCEASLLETLETSKVHINFLIDIELSHIHTKHPDFAVFEESESKANNGSGPVAPKKFGRGEENHIYKKGMLGLKGGNFLGAQKFEFFILKGLTLVSYKDERAIEPNIQVSVDGCRIRDYETGYSKKKNVFQLYHKDDKLIAKDTKSLDFICMNKDEALEWKAAFMAAGVVTDRQQEESTETPEANSEDINLVRQIQYIYALVEAYLKIITKNEVDLVAKICIFTIIQKMRNVIITDIVAHVYSVRPIDELLEESAEIIAKREQFAAIYNSCKEALKIISDVMSYSIGRTFSNSGTTNKSFSNYKINNDNISSGATSKNSNYLDSEDDTEGSNSQTKYISNNDSDNEFSFEENQINQNKLTPKEEGDAQNIPNKPMENKLLPNKIKPRPNLPGKMMPNKPIQSKSVSIASEESQPNSNASNPIPPKSRTHKINY